MFDSLERSQSDFRLHYLCLDSQSFDKLKSIGDQRLIPYSLEDILSNDHELASAKNRLQYRDFCFALASYFSKFILSGGADSVLYMDSDLYFYNDLKVVYNEIGEKSVGVIRHRHVERGHFVGEYNVGIVYFKNDEHGNFCCNKWWEWVSDPSNPFSKEYGTCGDQKYLELFDSIIPVESICVIDDESSHLAPFNFHLYDFKDFNAEDRVVWYKGKKHPATFCHFMKFSPDFLNLSYAPTDEPHNQAFMSIEWVRFLYDEYFLSSKNTTLKYNL